MTKGVVSEVTLLAKSDSNMLHEEWTWYAFLRLRKDGRFTLSFRRETQHPLGVYRPASLVGFRGAVALFQSLDGMWPEHTGYDLDELGWDCIVEKVDVLDLKLADELRQILQTERNPPPPSQPSPAEMHAAGARWSQEGFGGAGGLNGAVQGALRRRAAVFYTRRYFEHHGNLPEGEHLVDVSVGPRGSGADIEPPMGTRSHQLKVAITYPPPSSVSTDTLKADAEDKRAPDFEKALRVACRVLNVGTWNQVRYNTLRRLHAKAMDESGGLPQKPGGDSTSHSWRSLERLLFGEPKKWLKRNSEYGSGFSASLIDGPSVNISRVAGLKLTDELADSLADNADWQSVINTCPSATLIETSEYEGGPGMSDTFFWVAVADPERFGRELREAILKFALQK